MKIKNRKTGKVHPSPSSSSSSLNISKNSKDALSVLNLLPAAILALASILSLQDREVLAYMITRSMKSPTSAGKKCKNPIHHHHINPPLFDCDCFDCYTCYWSRWDSSPNRELIHQAIEAFEEHDEPFNKINGKSNRKEKQTRRLAGKCAAGKSPVKVETGMSPEVEEASVVITLEKVAKFEVVNGKETDVDDVAGAEVTVKAAANGQHKAMSRKVLPDVLSVFNSRLWSLWRPNV